MISAAIIFIFADRPRYYTTHVITNAPVWGNDKEQVWHTVSKVIDGDTIYVYDSIRLIGIDSPESHRNHKLYRDEDQLGIDATTLLEMGKRAAKFTENLVLGKKVKFELDVQERDKYGRLLAYVYLADGTFVNAEIVKQGYAAPMTIPPNVKYSKLFQDLYREARENGRGLWQNP